MNVSLPPRGLVIPVRAPTAAVFHCGPTVGIGWGLRPDDVDVLTHADNDSGPLAEAICARLGDASIIMVETVDGAPVALSGWRGLTSCHEVFFAVEAGSAVVGDHLRDVLAVLPTDRRRPSPETLADHFIFRTIPAPGTIAAAVSRLGRGERIDIELGRGTVRLSTFDRADAVPTDAPLGRHVDRLDRALGDAMAPLRHETQVASLFSGGVDSTLLQTYLGHEVPAVHYVLPRFRREFERHYADRAARHLGIGLQKVPVSTDDFEDRMVSAVRLTGSPPPHIQFCFYESLFRTGHRTFVMGEQGDALFGISVRKVKAASFFATPGRIRLLEAAAPLVPQARRRRFLLLPNTARRLRTHPRDPASYASRMGVYSDEGLLASVFGPDMLAERLESRRQELDRIADPVAPQDDRFLGQVEAAQLLDYLTEDMMTCYRHLAHGLGKSVVSPFLDRGVFDAAMNVPPEGRYARGLEGKHLLKAVLRRRLPAYPVNQRKGYSGIELASLYPAGALAGFWDRYGLPDALREVGDSIVGSSGPMTWNAMTLAVWQREIAGNEDLQTLPDTRVLSWSAGDPMADGRTGAVGSRP